MYYVIDLQIELLKMLKTRKVNAYPAFIAIQKREEYKTFMSNFGKHFINVY
ncbi:hypothetical protein [Anaeromicropila populeti]|nr:hypothetical protein [Anaeromicropila populeti]